MPICTVTPNAWGQQLCASDKLLRHFQHNAVIGRNVGFAFCCVDDHRIHFAKTAKDLHMGRERGAAAADDTSVFNDLRQLLAAQRFRMLHGFNVLG